MFVKPYVASHLKDMNRKVIYHLMEEKKVLSKTDISRITGISAPTVMKITSYLVEKGILQEQGEGRAALGRKPMLLRFNPEAAYTLIAEYRVGVVECAILNLKGEIKCSETHEAGFTCDFAGELVGRIDSLIAGSGIDRARIAGIGILIPGAIDPERGIIHFAPLIGVERRTDISASVKRLNEETGLPVFIENDVNAAAYGEYCRRRQEGDDDIVYLTVGNGVGAGIIIGGSLYKGMRSSAGEVGYMVFDRMFRTSQRQGGWLEEQIDAGWKDAHKRSSADALDDIASNLGLCIANIATVLDIRTFVLGGEVPRQLGGPFLSLLREKVERLCLYETAVEREQDGKPGFTGMAAIVSNGLLDVIIGE